MADAPGEVSVELSEGTVHPLNAAGPNSIAGPVSRKSAAAQGPVRKSSCEPNARVIRGWKRTRGAVGIVVATEAIKLSTSTPAPAPAARTVKKLHELKGGTGKRVFLCMIMLMAGEMWSFESLMQAQIYYSQRFGFKMLGFCVLMVTTWPKVVTQALLVLGKLNWIEKVGLC